METNPYATPGSSITSEPDNLATLSELVRGWEKLRLFYNAILSLPGLLVLALLINRAQMPVPTAFAGGAFVAACANAAFFLGPLSELYFRGFFTNGKSLGRGRWLIFGAGLTLSLGVFLIFASAAFI